ncbi:cell separation protein [Fusobacterium nucleatum]|uniref:Cell separation protein n=1 Tax=Fusobacterium nucleatum subsp. polymorphum TaxID=76857 RepID=A0A2C6AYV8_FUSNP|nr:DUF6683 family protein [Fusobacterium polymorphum]PHH97103.1 cell separation protein [Fusobacterium polymorphum]
MGKTFKYLFIAIIVGASLFISKPAYSFMGYWYDYNTGWIEQDIMRRTFENHNRVFNNSSSNDDYEEPAPPKKAKITFKSNGDTRGLDYYVNRYPENQRKEARTYFKSIQDSFPQVAKSVGIPTNDLSTGMAALVAGAYMAYNNVSLNDDYMKPLQKQFKEAFESVSDYDKMSDSDKKYLYDQMVILGMTLAVTQSQNQQNPNPKTTAELRKAGKEVLEGMIGVDASQIKITSSGLSF